MLVLLIYFIQAMKFSNSMFLVEFTVIVFRKVKYINLIAIQILYIIKYKS